MKLLLDMNLSPRWIDHLRMENFEAYHWSEVGDLRATDQTIFDWARVNGAVVLTADLDFGELVVKANSRFPSVVLVRATGTLPADIGEALTRSLRLRTQALEEGALIVFQRDGDRVRQLPYRGA